MPSNNRRAADRRRAWGRGPIILRLELLEGRQLLAASPVPKPDAVATAFDTVDKLDWGDSFHAVGSIQNRGDASINDSLQVAVYASPGMDISRASVLLGELTVPAGLEAGASFQFDESFSLPPTPLAGVAAKQPVYISLRVDPMDRVPESDELNNEGIAKGVDTSVVTIAQHTPSNLIGTSLGIAPGSVTWGDAITVTAQVKNDAAGEAPATRARIVLTKGDVTPGGPEDVTIGNIAIPAVAPFQSVNVVETIRLPARPPALLDGGSQYILSMVQDADFLTDAVSPHKATQGVGRDMAIVTIAPAVESTTVTTGTAGGTTTTTTTTGDPATAITTAILPDLAVATVSVPAEGLDWGYNFLAAARIENLGGVDAGPFRVRFYLTGLSGSLDHSLFLGDTIVDGLEVGANTLVTQTLKLPNRVPMGLSLQTLGTGMIAVVIDPENTFDESLKTNNAGGSAPVKLRILSPDGEATDPAVLPAIGKAQQRAQARLAGNPAAQERRIARLAKSSTNEARRRRLAAIDTENKTLEHRLKVFPRKVGDFFTDLFNG